MEQNSKSPLSIIEKKVLENIPSGSGIMVKNDTAYIIGDDATGVYRLNLGSYRQEKIPLTGFDHNIYREPKPVKRDFECATQVSWNGDDYLLAFGSGSSSPARDSLLMAKMSDPSDHKIFSVRNFYSRLQSLTLTSAKDWNIEGATAVNGHLILLNRGNNVIIDIKLNDFMLYISDNNLPFPPIEFHRIKLPVIQNHEARLSGACTIDGEHLLFSASIEDTQDWINDGPVLGSFIGIYSWRTGRVIDCFMLPDENGEPLKEKIESLDMLQNVPGEGLIFIAIGDNDNGTSTLYKLKLQIVL